MFNILVRKQEENRYDSIFNLINQSCKYMSKTIKNRPNTFAVLSSYDQMEKSNLGFTPFDFSNKKIWAEKSTTNKNKQQQTNNNKQLTTSTKLITTNNNEQQLTTTNNNEQPQTTMNNNNSRL